MVQPYAIVASRIEVESCTTSGEEVGRLRVAPLEGATRRRFKRFVRLPVLRLVWNKLEDM